MHAAFASVLATLAAELPELRRPLDARPHRLDGDVARRMHRAVAPYRLHGVTPMAAVAGAVADHVLAAAVAVGPPARAYVNNGGDVALHVSPGQALHVGVHGGVDDRVRGGVRGGAEPRRGGRSRTTVHVDGGGGIGGVATSGRGGRSHSLGIADAVTVLARNAAAADAAATIIANAVDLPGSSRVTRAAAVELTPDSDLGERLVTIDVAALDADERARALAAGTALARRLLGRADVLGVRLELQSEVVLLGRSRFADRAGTG